jgi:hypothetical protein
MTPEGIQPEPDFVQERGQWPTISRRCTPAFPALRREIVARRGFFALVARRKLLVNAGR